MRKFKEIFDRYTFSVVTGLWAMAFFVASFVVPPTGEIDSSVLAAIGEIFAFVTAVAGIKEWGVNYRKSKRIPESENEIEI